MKIACFSESPADQAALAVLVEGILGEKPELDASMDLQAHGHAGLMTALEGVVRGLHFNSDADGLVVVVDCDNTELHDTSHEALGGERDGCRLCKMRKIVSRALSQLKPFHGRPILKVATGLAVPTIEGWYLVGKNHQVGEAAWKVKPPFDSDKLKVEVYGTDRPSMEREIECAVNEARRLVGEIARIEADFPIGFGQMAKQIRSWKAPAP